MNVLNGSDSEDMDGVEDPEEDEDNSGLSPITPPTYQTSSVNNFFGQNNSQYFAQNNYLKSDLNNNNLTQMQYNTNPSAYSKTY